MSERTFDNFDDHASHYRKIHTQNVKLSGADSFYFASQKAELIASFENRSDISILDVGCGDGAVEIFLKEKFPQASMQAVDVSEKSISIARQQSLPDVQFSVYDGKRLPFGNESFDVVLLASVLHHVDFNLHNEVITEIRRVMKSGGRLYVFEHNPINPATQYIVKTCAFDKDARLLSSGYALTLLRKSGFRNIKKRFLLFFPRHKWLALLHRVEPALSRLPLGAQYMLRAVK